MDDASLDDFLGGDGATSDDDAADDATAEGIEAAEGDGDDANGDDRTAREGGDEAAASASTASTTDAADEAGAAVEDEGADAVEPARSTLSFSPGGGECSDCGAAVGRRWTDGDALVCRECKEW